MINMIVLSSTQFVDHLGNIPFIVTLYIEDERQRMLKVASITIFYFLFYLFD
jgi:hypothetical protein